MTTLTLNIYRPNGKHYGVATVTEAGGLLDIEIPLVEGEPLGSIKAGRGWTVYQQVRRACEFAFRETPVTYIDLECGFKLTVPSR